MAKILSYVSYLLLAIGVIFVGLFFFGAMDEGTFANSFIIWSYILFGIAAVAVLGFAIFQLVSRPKQAMGALMGIGALGVVVLLSYIFASGEIPQFLGYEKFDITEGLSKYVGTGLWSMYILGILAVVSIIYTEVSKAFK